MNQANLPPAAVEKHDERDFSMSANVREEGTHDLGYYVAGQIDLVRGMGDRAEQVRELFFQQSERRGITGASYRSAVLSVDDQKRDYLFAERDLGKKAKATMGVRIANIGTDLYIEWRFYILPPIRFDVMGFIKLIGVILILTYIIGGTLSMAVGVFFGSLLAVLLMIAAVWGSYRAAANTREERLIGFQDQDAMSFRLAISAAIEEAIDLAGIAKELRTKTEFTAPIPQQRSRRFIF